MRVALVTDYDRQPRALGGSVVATYLSDALASAGVEVVRWLRRDGDRRTVRVTRRPNDSHEEVWEFSGLPPSLPFPTSTYHPRLWGALLREVTGLMTTHPVDIVVVFNLIYPGLWQFELGRHFGIRTVLLLLDYSPICPTLTRYRWDGIFCEGKIPLENCLKCSTVDLPLNKKHAFWLLRQLPRRSRVAISRVAPSFFPAVARYHAGSAMERELARAGAQQAFRTASLVIYQSEEMRRVFRGAGLVGSREAVQVFGTPPVPPRYATMKQAKITDVAVRFGYLSRSVEMWGIFDLAAEWLHRFRGLRDRKLVIHSPGARAAIRGRFGDIDVDNIEIHEDTIQGRLEEVYADLHVLVLPAQWKGIVALTALEALAHNRPVLEPDCGGLADYQKASGRQLGVMTYRWRDWDNLFQNMDLICRDRNYLAQYSKSAQPVLGIAEWGGWLVRQMGVSTPIQTSI